MAIIVVEVMPKRELLDPAGKAVLGAFHRSGIEGFHEVRIGKRFELHVDGPATESHLADARKMADDLLSNGVIEDVLDVRVEDSPA
ncbi:MAG: phosphoribosylformylglycinamidine synthase subunit PurS [Pontimonas sp.]|nr:phosphoribosylformylglycinamidine synthase subunit PurS [Pontimonas sp.]MDA8862890.1 phosphoribosylformylglycinamidine synthase subunit PurS [Pontimonas sp.]MDA8887138.1 phosphoribosylformylglycinamidine synthase subunit PurS [Pontimonas sp.]MDP4633594.1 phosphoribosylformylglycinamidine synthase subunit PurS [Pontimonas sp.]MDP4688709.1 phosphoribosylformylglycinamidine synthase subunit PurS [Pontimonas sp.]MDP4816768.1 phosphoribosylformylglycinamidine synthase subunit PurS [Pontimonas sp